VRGERRLILSTDDRADGFHEVPLGADGTYDQRVPAGTYRVDVWHEASARGVAVALRREGQTGGGVATRPSGQEGSFRFHGVLPGRYELLLAGSEPLLVVVAEGDVEVRRDLTIDR
jgi:hypothetical protein